MIERKNLYITIIVSITIICSFFLYSAAFNPLLHSDHALNILMAHDYSLPETVYCWNQNRGGTFIPFISQLFIWGLGINAIFAVSISNYLILTLGFLGFSKLLKHKELMIPFALIWFFPYQRFIDITSFPIGMSYSLLGISLLFILKINLQKHLLKNLSNLCRLIASTIIWFCAVWVSDLTYISLITIGITSILYLALNRQKITFNFKILISCYLAILILIGLGIAQLKTFATGEQEQFVSFNTIDEIITGFKIVWNSIQFALFDDYLFTSIGAWIILFSIVAFILYFIKNFKSFVRFQYYWINLFLIDFIAVLCVIFSSKWVLLNDFGRWYFIAPYISGSILFFLILDKQSFFGISKERTSVYLTVIILIVGYSNIESILKTEGEYKSEYSQIKELNKLGEIGIIGDYWASYIYATANPSQIKSTPHEHSDIKNYKLFYEAIAQPKIFLVRWNWMDSYPDSITQFGFDLIKNGEPFKMLNTDFCEYKLKFNKTYLGNEMKTQKDVSIQTDGTIIFQKNNIDLKNHSIYGPSITLIRGNYEVEFYLKTIENTAITIQLIADVTSDYGYKTIKNIKLGNNYFNKQKNCYTIKFKIADTKREQVEFRILAIKPIDFIFEKINVIKID